MLIKGLGGEVYKMNKSELGALADRLYKSDSSRYCNTPSRDPNFPETMSMVPNGFDSYRDQYIAMQVRFVEAKRVSDSMALVNQAAWRSKQFGQTNNGFTIPVANNESKFMTVKINNLGWINCDRFYGDPRPKTNLAVNYGRPTATMMAYLPNINSMMPLTLPYDRLTQTYTGTKYTAPNLPIGEPVKLIVMEVVDGKILLSIQDIKVGTEVIEPQITEVSKQELQTALDKLNG
jgi:hypothetical protein